MDLSVIRSISSCSHKVFFLEFAKDGKSNFFVCERSAKDPTMLYVRTIYLILPSLRRSLDS